MVCRKTDRRVNASRIDCRVKVYKRKPKVQDDSGKEVNEDRLMPQTPEAVECGVKRTKVPSFPSLPKCIKFNMFVFVLFWPFIDSGLRDPVVHIYHPLTLLFIGESSAVNVAANSPRDLNIPTKPKLFLVFGDHTVGEYSPSTCGFGVQFAVKLPHAALRWPDIL